MTQQANLARVNGSVVPATHCAYCGNVLGEERAVASHLSGGAKFFCKLEPGSNPQYSCLMQWKLRRQH